MNIFILDQNTVLNAQMHADKHVVKMIVEYCQLLSTSCHVHNVAVEGMYRKTHVNHPSAVWARETRSNFEYLLTLTIDLLNEYTHRYGKVHASSRLIPLFIDAISKIPAGPLTPFAIVVDKENTLGSTDAVAEYRHLYKTSKRAMCTWKNRNQPEWF